MSNISYLIVHKDHKLDVGGVNAGAEMATLFQARHLVRAGYKVVVCAQLAGAEETRWGVEFWDMGDDYDVAKVLKRAEAIAPYHLISEGRALPLLQSRGEQGCVSRSLISHDRASNDTGIAARVLSHAVDNIICVSNAQKSFFLDDGAEAEKVTVIHNGADREIFQVGEAKDRDYQRLVFSGALVPDKGIHYLVECFVKLKEKYPDLKLDVYGSSAMWGREKMFDEQEIERQVPGIKFHGGVEQAVVAEAYRQAGITVVPSIWFDPFPLSSIEAQITGCPVVTFNVGGLAEGVKDGETGVVIKDISQAALIQTLDELLSAPERLEEMSRNAIAKQRPYFTWERYVDELSKLCEGAAESKNLSEEQESDNQIVRKKLGFLTTWNQECGLATYARYLVGTFEEGTYVVLGEDEETAQRNLDEDFVERCWNRDSENWDTLYQVIKKHDIGLLHLNAQARFFRLPSFINFLNKIRAEGVKTILHLHSVFTLETHVQALVSSVDRVIVHTPESRLEVIANGAKAENVDVLPHGVHVRPSLSEQEKQSLRQRLGMPPNEKIAVCFGFIQPHKGMEVLIEAVADLNNSGMPCRGYVAGKIHDPDPNAKQYLEQLKTLAHERSVSDKIVFLDRFLDNDEVADYLAASDLVFMNYHSQYYEASGACSLAIGAGALVATSIAPPFVPFGDAVWHLTAGFSPSISMALLLSNEELQAELKANVRKYCEENSWQQISLKLKDIYKKTDFQPEATQKENVVIQEEKSSRGTAGAIRVLIQNRSNTFTQRGGDTVVIEQVVKGLEKRGVSVTVDLQCNEDPAQYDLVHLINFALPDMLESLAQRAYQAKVPYLVTTLCEDIPHFHNQSIAVAELLKEYQKRGQEQDWYAANEIDLKQIVPCEAFNNAWVAQHASALLTNGSKESEVIKKTYGDFNNIVEVKLGYEIGAEGDPELFKREYGIDNFVFCVGRLESRKNQLMLLKALEDSELPVVIAGGGFSYQPEYEQAVRKFRRKGQTIVLDRVSAEMLASAYAAAKVHVLPSWYELPGLVSLEAAYHGANVVVTEAGTASDYLGDKAFYCDPADHKSVYNATIAAYYSPVKEGLKEQVMANTWDAMAEKTLEVYQQILGVGEAQVDSATQPVETKAIPVTQNPTALAFNPYNEVHFEEFQELLEAGEAAAREKQYNYAHEKLAEAEKLNPQSPRVLRARGAVYIAEQNPDRAKEYLERACDIEADDPKTLSGLGMCAMMKENAEEAYAYFVRALKLQPDQLVAILQLLECSYFLDRYDDLEHVLSEYVNLHPDDINMQFCYAGCLLKLDRLEAAEALNDKVLEASPNHIGAKELKDKIDEIKNAPKDEAQEANTSETADSEIAFDASVVSDAISKLAEKRSQTKASATNLDIENRLSDLEEHKRQRNYEEVISGCEELLESSTLLNGQLEKTTLLKAEAFVLKGETDEALEIFEGVLKENPQSARALCGKGAISGNQGDWLEAQECFKKAQQYDPENDVAPAGLGLCAVQRRAPQEAWSLYRRSLQINPENTMALLGLVELAYTLGNYSDLEEALTAYIDMHPADLNFLYSLAGCYFAQGKLQEALSEVRKILLFEPQHENAVELEKIINEKLDGGAVETSY